MKKNKIPAWKKARMLHTFLANMVVKEKIISIVSKDNIPFYEVEFFDTKYYFEKVYEVQVFLNCMLGVGHGEKIYVGMTDHIYVAKIGFLYSLKSGSLVWSESLKELLKVVLADRGIDPEEIRLRVFNLFETIKRAKFEKENKET